MSSARDKLIETMARVAYENAEHHKPREFAATWPMLDGRSVQDMYRGIAKAQLAALESSGMVVVPVEPTEEMRVAFWNAFDENSKTEDVWHALLSASPTQRDASSDQGERE